MELEKFTGERGPNWRDIATLMILAVVGLGAFVAAQVWDGVAALHDQVQKIAVSQVTEAAALRPTLDDIKHMVTDTRAQVSTVDARLTTDEQRWQATETDLGERVSDDQLRLNRDEADWHAAKAINEAKTRRAGRGDAIP